MSKTARTSIMVALMIAGIGAVVAYRVHQRNKQIAWDMYADIHNIATSQAAYYIDNSTFAKDLSDRYQPTHGAVVKITSASDTSWSAVATHPGSTKECAITYAQPQRATNNQVNAARYAAMNGYACK